MSRVSLVLIPMQCGPTAQGWSHVERHALTDYSETDSARARKEECSASRPRQQHASNVIITTAH